MPYLSNHHTYAALEYDIIYISPTKTNKAVKFQCGHSDDTRRQPGTQVPTRGCAGLAVWATAALQCKVSDHLQTQINLKTLLFPSSCQILSVCRKNSQGWSLTGINASSQSSDSTAKVTGVRTIHDELWIPAKTLIYDYMPIYWCHWLYLPTFSAGFGFFSIFRNNCSPIRRKAHTSHLSWHSGWKKPVSLLFRTK